MYTLRAWPPASPSMHEGALLDTFPYLDLLSRYLYLSRYKNNLLYRYLYLYTDTIIYHTGI